MTPVHDGLFDADGLRGGTCGSCARRHFPRATTCPWCGGDAIEDVTLSTRGRLWAWTAVQAPPPGYGGDVPYGFGVVDLPDDGLRVVTRLVDDDPSTLHEGDEMRFTIVAIGEVSTYAYEAVR